MSRQFAKGTNAIAECQRSGQKMRFRDLVEDGHIAGLLVHPDWWEPKHPQEIPVNVTDPVALYRPAPEISIEAGYGNPELGGAGTGICLTAPDTGSYPRSGTLSTALSGSETHIVANEAVVYPIGECLFIELDAAAGWYVSKITSTADAPAFVIPFTTAFSGAAAIGNDFYIGVDGAAGAKS